MAEENENIELEEEKENSSESEIEKWKALSRKWEEKSKNNFEELKKLQDIEQKYSSLAEKYNALNSETTILKKKNIVKDFKLPEDAIEFLSGETEDDWKQKAEKLSKLTNPLAPEKKPLIPPTKQGEVSDASLSGKITSKDEFLARLKQNLK